MKQNMRRVYDPLYGVITLSKIEYEIMKSPEIQRLRYVRMSNINSMLITGASEISRFEHIIGVLWLTKLWISNQRVALSVTEAGELCAAALLHDFQTGPFGHSLQYVFEDNKEGEHFIHEDLDHATFKKFHQITDANVSFSGRPFTCKKLLNEKWENVTKIIKGEGRYGKLISGTIDLDNIDNVIRLAYHAGVATTEDAIVATTLAKDIFPRANGLEVSIATIPHIKRWQEIRKRLYELLLLDWAEFTSKAMLTRAMELAIDHGIIGTDCWLKTDLELISYLESSSIGEAQGVGELVKRIKCGELYDPLLLIKSSQIEIYDKFSNILKKRELEYILTNLIKEKLNLNVSLIIHAILDKRKTDRSVDIIVRESGKLLTIGSNSRRILMGVFLSKNIESIKKRQDLNTLVAQFLASEGMVNYCDIDDPIIEKNTIEVDSLQQELF